MIRQTSNNRHWNYLLALDRDASVIARFIEFTPENFGTYSIELARLLMAAASEVDVVAKMACAKIKADTRPDNINEYRKLLVPNRALLTSYPVCIQRFGLDLTPWSNWADEKTGNPDWWRAYNKVKHERSAHFPLANLHNALNALAGLFVMLIHAFPDESTAGLLHAPELLSIPDDAHNGWSNKGTYDTVFYRV